MGIFDVFMGEGEHHILLLCSLDPLDEFLFFFFFFFFFFFGLPLRHLEVPRLGVEIEL